MTTLIVYSRPPGKNSHNAEILRRVKEELKRTHEAFEVLDLYKEDFDPRLTFDENGEDAEKYQELIKKHSHYVFIYPIWWNAPPAILKGFLDIVLTAGFAFKYKTVIGNIGRPVGLLEGKRAVTISTGGAPKILYWLFQGRRGDKIVTKDTLATCGITAKNFHLGRAQKYSEEKDPAIQKLVRNALYWLY